MFTGIITDLGKVKSVSTDGTFIIETALDLSNTAMGASISCNGVCLTVVEKNISNDNTTSCFTAHVSPETLSCTTLGDWKSDTPVNLESAMCMGDEFGGHMVSGHVDGVATVLSRNPDSENPENIRFSFSCQPEFIPMIAPKGSITINGVSLTVNEVDKEKYTFGVNIIPHTQEVTSFGDLQAGNKVNMEVDMMARYVDNILKHRAI